MSQPKVSEGPVKISVSGRLSFPVFTMAEAIERDKTSMYPAMSPDYISPGFNLLLDQKTHDRIVEFFLDTLLPSFIQDRSENEKWGLDAKEAKRVETLLRSGDLSEQPPYIPLKPVPEKSQAMAPEAVSQLNIKGRRGADIKLQAIVNSAEEVLDGFDHPASFPALMSIGETIHSLYPGSIAAATLTFYPVTKAKPAGFQARATTAVFKADAEQFGAGEVEFDLDDLFLDD